MLQKIIDSKHFHELMIYDRMYTLDEDTWMQTTAMSGGKVKPPTDIAGELPQEQTPEQMQRLIASRVKVEGWNA